MNKIEETYDVLQPMLETLNLEFNQIFTAQFDNEKLPKLKELDLKGNHLIDLNGVYPQRFTKPPLMKIIKRIDLNFSLERLFVAQNKISRLNDLSQLTNLTTLHLRDNNIRKLNGFTQFLTKLTYLNLRSNNIMKLRQFRKLSCLPNLEILVYTGNPMEGKKSTILGIQGEGGADDTEVEDEEAFGEDGPDFKKPAFDPIRIGVLVLLPNLKVFLFYSLMNS